MTSERILRGLVTYWALWWVALMVWVVASGR